MSMARIMILTNSASGGGAERSMNVLATQFIRGNIEVSMIRVNKWKSDDTEPSCETFSLDRDWKSGLLDTLMAIFRFRRAVISWAPTHLLVNCELPSFVLEFQFPNCFL